MKTPLLLFAIIAVTGCQQMQQKGVKTRSALRNAPAESAEVVREKKQRSVQEMTESRVRSYEKRGYTNAEARAVAEAEYFRSGK